MMYKALNRFFCLVLCTMLMLSPLTGFAEVTINFVLQKDEDNQVSYPELLGMDNLFVMQSVNDLIKTKGMIADHINTLTAIKNGLGGRLKMDSYANIYPSKTGHHLFAVLISAQGRLPGGRNGYMQTPMMFDLANGQEVSGDALFPDMSQAQMVIDQLAEDSLATELSNYLDISNLVPVPLKNTLLDEVGVWFYYPQNSLTLLSGKTASFRFLYHELGEILDVQEGSLLYDLQLTSHLTPQADSLDRIKHSLSHGRLPGIAVALQENLPDLLSREPLAFDPEGFPDGQKYQLENDAYRGTALVSRDEKTVAGLFSRRMNLFGLITGKSNLEDIKQVMQEPVASAPLDASAATLYGLQEGSSLQYRFSDNDLWMFLDQEGILQAIYLSTTN